MLFSVIVALIVDLETSGPGWRDINQPVLRWIKFPFLQSYFETNTIMLQDTSLPDTGTT